MSVEKEGGREEGVSDESHGSYLLLLTTHKDKLVTRPCPLLPVLRTSSCLGHPHSQGHTRRHGPQPAFCPLLNHISLPHKRGPKPVIVRREGTETERWRVRPGRVGASSVGGAGGRRGGGGMDGRRGRDSDHCLLMCVAGRNGGASASCWC